MENTILEAPITITESAIVEIMNLQKNSNQADKKYLRIGVKGGGCSGLTYILEFDVKEDDDIVYNLHNINVVMKNAHNIYLDGIQVDYLQGLNNRGFTFTNPNASSTCGCGTSFAV